ncbi:DsbA family protein [Uliginosibacterium sp. TH139]|uniref:DsbA family protein n=1 Tax=Uliginosibacterium sp. TH139 TaxID=2067453 RepID=UPI000C7BFB9C|nr:DsbA family protein [Uliginosibacterium sp. TH139]PLK50651.1 protein-disulfide isomerase [Uliginosibacterium sp. TH139]
MSTLHYIFDPLCGWCYAVAPLLRAAREVPGLSIALHGGGMMTGANRRSITPQWRDYVLPHDRRIAQLTGQPFGEAYFEGLLRDTTAVMDSAPPTTAILAAEELAGRGLDMAHRLQHAHYAEGRRIADQAVLQALAAELGLEVASFTAAFERLAGEATEQHFRDSRHWLARVGGQGFPTLVLEQADGALTRIDVSPFLGQPDAFAAALRQQVPAADAAEMIPHCGLDGCTDA